MLKKFLGASAVVLAAAITMGAAQAQPAAKAPAAAPAAKLDPKAEAANLSAQAAHLARARGHIANAQKAAGKDYAWFQQMLCSNPQLGGDIIGMFFGASRLNAPDADFEPVKVFDNLYYVGLTEIGAWAVTTSDGIILIDALFPGQEEDRLVANLKKVGLDPAQVKMVIVTHAHPDHGGGAKYMQEKYGSKIIFSAVDWGVAEKGGVGQNNAPRRDVVLVNEGKVTLGDTTIQTVFTPGHTPGSISVLVPVKEGGVTHTAMMWGGPQWGFRNADVPQRELYERSLVKFHKAVRDAKADVVLESHPFLSNLTVKLAEARSRKPGQPNPLIVGEDGADRYMTIWTECGRANMERYKQYQLKHGPEARNWPHPPLMDGHLH